MKGELREFLKEAEKLGFKFDGYDGHGHVRLYNETTGHRYPCAATPSDCNGRKNALADLRKLAHVEPAAVVELFKYCDGDDPEQDVRVVVDSPMGEPVWIGRDVCEVVGISKYRDALAQLDADERVSVVVDTLGGPQEMTAVTEAGVWSLLLISRSPKVKPFKRWLTHHVLPQIRQTGAYAPEPAQEAIPSHAEALRGWADEVERRHVVEAERDTALDWAAELEGPANAFNELIDLKTDHKVGDAAKILSRDPQISIGQNRLFNFMKSTGWAFRNRDTGRWCAYQSAVDRGWLVEKPGEKYFDKRSGEYRSGDPVVLVAPKGLQELHKRLSGNQLSLEVS